MVMNGYGSRTGGGRYQDFLLGRLQHAECGAVSTYYNMIIPK